MTYGRRLHLIWFSNFHQNSPEQLASLTLRDGVHTMLCCLLLLVCEGHTILQKRSSSIAPLIFLTPCCTN